jgi:hypothetical protein
MRFNRAVVALAFSLPCAVVTASCVQSPTREDSTAAQVAADDEDTVGDRVGEATEALTVINCKGLGLDVVECMIRCAEAGIPCTPRLAHPRKVDAGEGDLFRCGQLGSRKSCTYSYSNGDACAVISGLPWIPCIYTGG